MNRVVALGIAAGLFALGVFAGKLFFASAPEVAASVKKPAVASKRIADGGESAALAALRRRVAELEKLLAEARGTQEEAASNAVAAARRERGPGRWGGPRLEELKEKDPARYTEITNKMAQFRQRRQERARAQLDFLSSVDTSRMSKSAKITHANYQDLIARRQELEEQLHAEGITDEERKALFKELHGTSQAMRIMGQSERNVLVEETARNLGFTGDDVKLISETMRDIVDATDSFGHGGPPPGPPPGGAGGPPGGPGGGPR